MLVTFLTGENEFRIIFPQGLDCSSLACCSVHSRRCRWFGGCQPADGCLRHAIGSGEIGLHSAFRKPPDDPCRWCGVRAAERPNFTLFALASFRPVRGRMNSRSNSA